MHSQHVWQELAPAGVLQLLPHHCMHTHARADPRPAATWLFQHPNPSLLSTQHPGLPGRERMTGRQDNTMGLPLGMGA